VRRSAIRLMRTGTSRRANDLKGNTDVLRRRSAPSGPEAQPTK
jgi:hypothetical protein